MKYGLLILGAAALSLLLAGCSGAGSSSSGSTLAEGSSPIVNGSGSSLTSSVSSTPAQEDPELRMMTVDEALDYFNGLNPQDLGLPGETMEEYQTYPSEKAVPVDGLPCMKLIVYADSSAGTNAPEATFLVARDGSAVYRLENGEVTQLEIG